MSAAAAAEETPAAPKKGKKKLIIIVAAAVLVLGGGGGGAFFYMKKKAHDAEAAAAEAEGGDGHAAPKKAAKHDPKATPTYVPLDPFTVNLSDRDADRYAQIGITLEIGDPHVGDQIKAFMPAIRNNILMLLAQKTSVDMAGRDGKTKLAAEVQRETERALGVETEEPEADDHGKEDKEAADEEGSKKKKKAKKKPKAEVAHLIAAVHFSNFIIQ